jgi:hypothetical protein
MVVNTSHGLWAGYLLEICLVVGCKPPPDSRLPQVQFASLPCRILAGLTLVVQMGVAS